MGEDIQAYNDAQESGYQPICKLLAEEIQAALPNSTSKVWHGSPVWFIDGNPVAGYSVLKDCVQLLFWSGQSFDEPGLRPEGKFKAAEARYTDKSQINSPELKRWLNKAQAIQWDYKSIVKQRGVLERLK